MLRDVAMAMALLAAEEQEFDTPNYCDEAEHILPDIIPWYDAACSQKQQDAYAATNNCTCLVAVTEDVDETRNYDEECPPSF